MLPKYVDVELPLLRELVRRGGAAKPRDLDILGRTVYASLADQFALSAADRVEATSESEGRPKWENMVRWARQKLLDRGLLIGGKHGVWQVSDDGLAYLRSEQEAQAQAAAAPTDPIFSDELASASVFSEGLLRRVYVNAYERNPAARVACITHYGPTCVLCKFNFASVYGPLAEGYIHVHHLVPLSQVGGEYEVDPVTDMRPVCPNCHAVIHLGGACREIEEVRQLLQGMRPTPNLALQRTPAAVCGGNMSVAAGSAELGR